MSGLRLGTVDDALEALRARQIVVIPTETVYGLVGDAQAAGMADGLRRIKGDRGEKPFPLLVSSRSMARTLAAAWPEAAARLAHAFWPGPLTIVVEAGRALDQSLLAGGATVGLRMPDHSVALEVIREFDGPLASTSANRSGKAPPTSAGAAIEALAGENLIVVDGGACRGSEASTVVSLADPDHPMILREGATPRARIEAILGAALG